MQSSNIFRYLSLIKTTHFRHISSAYINSQSVRLETNNQFQIFRLPQKNINNFIGDHYSNKLPIFDFKKTNPLYCVSFQLLNSNIFPVYYNELIKYDWNQNDTIIEYSIVPHPKHIKTIYLPTTENNTHEEKKADYYPHRYKNRFTHLIWVRHRKMKKHKRRKWRKKNLALIKRRLLEKNIAKEKAFRAELLAQVKEAEDFDPKVYVENMLYTIDNVPKLETPQQKYERYLDLIRKNRKETNFIKPKFEEIDK